MANSIGPYASRLPFPVGHTDGDRYFCNDSPYYFVANAGVWDAYYEGHPCIVPPVGLSQDNFGPMTLDQSKGYLHVSCYNFGGTNLSALYQAAPPAPYKITMGVVFNPVNEDSYSAGDTELSLGFRSVTASGDYSLLSYGITTFEIAPPLARGTLYLGGWSNATTHTATSHQVLDRAIFASFIGKPIFFEIEDDGANTIWRFGIDKNSLWEFFSQSYLTSPAEWAVTFRPGRGMDVIIFDLTGATIPAPPPLSITCASSSAALSIPYDSFLVASGGVPPYTFSIISGSLPTGLTLDTSTGEISGVPTMLGNFPYVAQVDDSDTHTDTVSCSITVSTGPLIITCASSDATLGTAYDSLLSAVGGAPPYTFSIISGSLPPGLTLNIATGEITGIPSATGNFPYQARVIDSLGGISSVSCTISVRTPSGGCQKYSALSGIPGQPPPIG